MKPRILLIIITFVTIFFSCGKKDNGPTGPEDTAPTAVDDYFHLAEGAKWEYRVNFSQNCNVPYSPWFEYPEGILSTSLTHGMGSWNAGQIDFEILINDIYEKSSNSSTWDISLNDLGKKFYFYGTFYDSTRLRLNIESGNAKFDLIGVMSGAPPRMRIARALARLTDEDLSQKFNISVPAGEFKNCVKTVVNVYYNGTYPIETYLAPNVGIVKAIGKNKDDGTLYTLELSKFNN
jgi:hypothetical protein